MNFISITAVLYYLFPTHFNHPLFLNRDSLISGNSGFSITSLSGADPETTILSSSYTFNYHLGANLSSLSLLTELDADNFPVVDFSQLFSCSRFLPQAGSTGR